MTYNEYYRRVVGCYTGKAVGGTLGMPFEGNLNTRHLTGYDPVPDTMLPNDDLDLQVIALELLRRHGLPVNRHHLSHVWDHLQDGGPDEYGPARWNVYLGRYAPLSGYFCNKFHGGMGAAIRSELWACLAPGNPALAVRLAYEDACTDHYDDGLEACMFLAALESAAFAMTDAREIIEVGLSFLKPAGRLAKGLRYAMECLSETGDPYAARERYLAAYYVQNWTDVTINLGLILIAWLDAGNDFGKAICTAAGLGYDTDCTAATLGSILGIMYPDSIGDDWTAPIGDALILSTSIMGMHEPETIGGFCDLVAAAAVEVSAYYGSTPLTDVPDHLPPMHKPWTMDAAQMPKGNVPHESMVALTPITVRLVYPDFVSIMPGETVTYTLILRPSGNQPLTGEVAFTLPEGWSIEPAAAHFTLTPGQNLEIPLTITAGAMDKKRSRDNDLDMDFTVDGITWTVSADLPVTIPWERTNLDTGEIEILEARAVFQTVPKGHYRYRTVCKVNPYMPVRFAVMSTRAFTASLNGKEILRGEGDFYVPAYHRGKTTTNATTGKHFGCWNFVEIEVMDGDEGEMFFGMARAHNCCEWLVGFEYSLAPLQLWDAQPK